MLTLIFDNTFLIEISENKPIHYVVRTLKIIDYKDF